MSVSLPRAPWRDRSGRLSALRVVALLVLSAPAVWLAVRAAVGDLGPRPLTEALRFCGDRAIETLIAAIAITPLRRLSGWAKLVGVRRMIGLAAFFWAVGHFGLYVADQGGDLGKVASEIALRPYLTLGFVALVGLATLAATSTDGMIRRLGGARWGRLHGLVHAIAILTLVHFFLQVRLDPFWSAVVAGTALGGLAVRVAADPCPAGPLAVAIAAVAAWIGAAGGELAWFAAKTTRPLAPILRADFDTTFRVAPAWWAATIVLALGALALLRRRFTAGNGARTAIRE
ncbi:MAG: sulfoxide reductase heme-binding subunit YedZ [Phyllobacteriaceae bacterium]|nr:sulfoxide reductase heme-binding subunit YedZ [Phyllobacteriaceae bacterium]